MIINVSRSQGFQTCRRKQMFYDLGLIPLRLTEPLTMGSAYHKGVAIVTATRDKQKALEAAETLYREELSKAKLTLPEELPIHENNILIIKKMLSAQAAQYARDTWTVLRPEVEFLVELPNTMHHCWYFHQLLHPNIPFLDCEHESYHGEPPTQCWQPHRLKGRTDGILQWNNLVWIMERKTSAMKQEVFWDQWYLSHQLSAYVYGVRKSTGLPVHGVVLEKMPKPARNQNPLTFDYSPEREPYIRSESDLAEFESEMITIAHDYEAAAIIGKPAFYRNPQSCTNYNRKCQYWDVCKRGGTWSEGEFAERPQDYVEEAYYQVLNIPNPKTPKEVVNPDVDSL